MSRHRLHVLAVALITVAAFILGGCSRRSGDATATRAVRTVAAQVVRIIRPKQITGLEVLSKQGTLEARLAPLGYQVQWVEFAAGPQQMEGLNAGALDLAATAESPVIFAQAAGIPVVYLATTAPSGRSISLLVPSGSTVRAVADLKGKRVAYQKASIGHYLLVKALATAGLGFGDVTSVSLAPPEANVAFSQGKVDAWFIWEPFVTRAVQSGAGRVLLDGGALRDTGNFYSTTRAFAEGHPDVIKVFLAEVETAERWAEAHPQALAELLSPALAVDTPTLALMHAKYTYGVFPITPAVIEKQQQVANLYFGLGLLPRAVDVKEGLLTPEAYAALTPLLPDRR